MSGLSQVSAPVPNQEEEAAIEIINDNQIQTEENSPIEIINENAPPTRKDKHKLQNRIPDLVWQKNEEKRLREVAERKNVELENRIKAIETKSSQKEVQDKLAILNQKKVEALEISDAQQVVSLDQEIFQIMATNPGITAPVPVQTYNQAPQPQINADEYFRSRNPWYNPQSHSYRPDLVSQATQIDASLTNDPYWMSQPLTARLDEVSRRVNVQQAVYQAPSGYAPIQQPQFGGAPMVESGSQVRPVQSNEPIQISQADYKMIKGLHPNYTDKQIRDHVIMLNSL